MSAIVNGPKNGSRKPNDERTTSSTCSGVATPSSTILAASLNIANWMRFATNPGPSPDDDGGLARAGSAPRRPGRRPLVGRARGDHLDARDEQRRHEPVHAEEAARPLQPRCELRDRDGRRVRRDDGVVVGGRLDRARRRPASRRGARTTASTTRSAPSHGVRDRRRGGEVSLAPSRSRPARRSRPPRAARGAPARARVPPRTAPACCRRARSGSPFEAKTCAMPTPIVPAPTTATLDGQGVSRTLTATPSAAPRARPRRPPSASRRGAGAGRARRGRRLEVVLSVPDLAQPRRRADVLHQTLERDGEVVAAVEQPRRGRAPLRAPRPRRTGTRPAPSRRPRNRAGRTPHRRSPAAATRAPSDAIG